MKAGALAKADRDRRQGLYSPARSVAGGDATTVPSGRTPGASVLETDVRGEVSREWRHEAARFPTDALKAP